MIWRADSNCEDAAVGFFVLFCFFHERALNENTVAASASVYTRRFLFCIGNCSKIAEGTFRVFKLALLLI